MADFIESRDAAGEWLDTYYQEPAEVENVSSRLDTMLAEGSDYLTQAGQESRKAREKAGLLESGFTEGAGRASAIDSALGVATIDSYTDMLNQYHQNQQQLQTYDQAGKIALDAQDIQSAGYLQEEIYGMDKQLLQQQYELTLETMAQQKYVNLSIMGKEHENRISQIDEWYKNYNEYKLREHQNIFELRGEAYRDIWEADQRRYSYDVYEAQRAHQYKLQSMNETQKDILEQMGVAQQYHLQYLSQAHYGEMSEIDKKSRDILAQMATKHRYDASNAQTSQNYFLQYMDKAQSNKLKVMDEKQKDDLELMARKSHYDIRKQAEKAADEQQVLAKGFEYIKGFMAQQQTYKAANDWNQYNYDTMLLNQKADNLRQRTYLKGAQGIATRIARNKSGLQKFYLEGFSDIMRADIEQESKYNLLLGLGQNTLAATRAAIAKQNIKISGSPYSMSGFGSFGGYGIGGSGDEPFITRPGEEVKRGKPGEYTYETYMPILSNIMGQVYANTNHAQRDYMGKPLEDFQYLMNRLKGNQNTYAWKALDAYVSDHLKDIADENGNVDMDKVLMFGTKAEFIGSWFNDKANYHWYNDIYNDYIPGTKSVVKYRENKAGVFRGYFIAQKLYKKDMTPSNEENWQEIWDLKAELESQGVKNIKVYENKMRESSWNADYILLYWDVPDDIKKAIGYYPGKK